MKFYYLKGEIKKGERLFADAYGREAVISIVGH